MSHRTTKLLLGFMILIAAAELLLLVLGFAKVRQIFAGMEMGKASAPPPPSVTTLVVKGTDWQPVISSVGSLKAVNGVTITTDLAGIVSEIHFESGAKVKKGDLLLKLDARQEEAQLLQAQAKLDFSKVNLDRQKDLLIKKAVSQSDYDSADTSYRQDNASVENAKALIARKEIRAPFDGVLGIRQVNLGQYLNVGSAIVPLQSMDTLYVDFSLPQQRMAEVVTGKKILFTVSGLGDKNFEAEITSINSVVDEATRNVLMEATTHNEEGKLTPGMFVNVEVLLPAQDKVLAVPSSSVNYAPYGDSLYVIKKAKGDDGKEHITVDLRVVKLGATRGDQVSIISGLKEGEEVVTSGVFQLRANAAVQINNKVQPENEANPHPPDT